VAGVRVDQPGRLGRNRSSTSAPTALFRQVVQIGVGGVPLGVHDGVHVLRRTQHPQFGDGLVGGDDQLHARPLGRHQALAGHGVGGPARSVGGGPATAWSVPTVASSPSVVPPSTARPAPSTSISPSWAWR
jgi:hypothetical protein